MACGRGTACKERVGVGRWSAPGMEQCRGTRRRETVVGVCLVPEGCLGPVVKGGIRRMIGLIPSNFITL